MVFYEHIDLINDVSVCNFLVWRLHAGAPWYCRRLSDFFILCFSLLSPEDLLKMDKVSHINMRTMYYQKQRALMKYHENICAILSFGAILLFISLILTCTTSDLLDKESNTYRVKHISIIIDGIISGCMSLVACYHMIKYC